MLTYDASNRRSLSEMVRTQAGIGQGAISEVNSSSSDFAKSCHSMT